MVKHSLLAAKSSCTNVLIAGLCNASSQKNNNNSHTLGDGDAAMVINKHDLLNINQANKET
jgi:hypothetical protein